MRVTPDDEVYRVNTVWLGPSGLTFPWTARYLAYATWLITLLVVLLVEAITPLHVHVPPIWELAITTLFTYGVMGFVDHERPFGAVYQTFLSDLSAPRGGARGERYRAEAAVRVRDLRPGVAVKTAKALEAAKTPRTTHPPKTKSKPAGKAARKGTQTTTPALADRGSDRPVAAQPVIDPAGAG